MPTRAGRPVDRVRVVSDAPVRPPGVGRSHVPRPKKVLRDEADTQPVSKAARAASLLALAAILAVAAWVASEAVWTIRGERISINARRDVARWFNESAPPSLVAWERARREALAALALAPQSPKRYDLVSSLYFLRGSALPPEDPERQGLLEEAIRYQEKSLALLPENPYGWADLAVTRLTLKQDSRLIASDWNKILTYGRYETDVQRRLTVIALAIWPEASPQMKAWVRKVYQSGSAEERKDLKELAETFEVKLDEQGGG